MSASNGSRGSRLSRAVGFFREAPYDEARVAFTLVQEAMAARKPRATAQRVGGQQAAATRGTKRKPAPKPAPTPAQPAPSRPPTPDAPQQATMVAS